MDFYVLTKLSFEAVSKAASTVSSGGWLGRSVVFIQAHPVAVVSVVAVVAVIFTGLYFLDKPRRVLNAQVTKVDASKLASDKNSIKLTLKKMPVLEREEIIAYGKRLFTPLMPVDVKVDILEIIALSLQNEREDFVSSAENVFTKSMGNSEKLDILEAFQTISVTALKSVVDDGIPLLAGIKGASNRLKILEVLEKIPSDERDDFINYVKYFFTPLMSSNDKVDLIRFIHNEIELDEIDDFYLLNKRFLKEGRKGGDTLKVLRLIKNCKDQRNDFTDYACQFFDKETDGACIVEFLELLAKVPLNERDEFKAYANHPVIKKMSDRDRSKVLKVFPIFIESSVERNELLKYLQIIITEKVNADEFLEMVLALKLISNQEREAVFQFAVKTFTHEMKCQDKRMRLDEVHLLSEEVDIKTYSPTLFALNISFSEIVMIVLFAEQIKNLEERNAFFILTENLLKSNYKLMKDQFNNYIEFIQKKPTNELKSLAKCVSAFVNSCDNFLMGSSGQIFSYLEILLVIPSDSREACLYYAKQLDKFFCVAREPDQLWFHRNELLKTLDKIPTNRLDQACSFTPQFLTLNTPFIQKIIALKKIACIPAGEAKDIIRFVKPHFEKPLGKQLTALTFFRKIPRQFRERNALFLETFNFEDIENCNQFLKAFNLEAVEEIFLTLENSSKEMKGCLMAAEELFLPQMTKEELLSIINFLGFKTQYVRDCFVKFILLYSPDNEGCRQRIEAFNGIKKCSDEEIVSLTYFAKLFFIDKLPFDIRFLIMSMLFAIPKDDQIKFAAVIVLLLQNQAVTNQRTLLLAIEKIPDTRVVKVVYNVVQEMFVVSQGVPGILSLANILQILQLTDEKLFLKERLASKSP